MTNAISIRNRPAAPFGEVLSYKKSDLAEVAIGELKALRDVDFIAPPEAAVNAEALMAAFRVRPNAADRLRCPQMTHADGPTVTGAIVRVLSADVSAPSSDESAVIKEERMRRALKAIGGAMEHIRQQQPVAI